MNLSLEFRIAAAFQIFNDGSQQCAVVMAVNLGVLQEFACFHARSEFWFRQELIILAFRFSGTCRARGA